MTSRLTLFGRRDCHLCQDMLAALEELHLRRGGPFDFEVDEVDIDVDPQLAAKYNARIPVLEAAGRELCHHFLDIARVRDFLSGQG